MATNKYLNKTGLQRFWDGIKAKIAEKAKITLTGVDPGEGASLAAGEYIAVYGEPEAIGTSRIENAAVTTAKIADGAVTAAKIDVSSLYDVLYNNTSGTSGDVALSADPSNYVRLKIFIKDSDGNCGFTETYGGAQRFSSVSGTTWNSHFYMKVKYWTVNGSTLVANLTYDIDMYTSGVSVSGGTVYITRVEGWKI